MTLRPSQWDYRELWKGFETLVQTRIERYEAEGTTLLSGKNLPYCRLYIPEDIGLKHDNYFSKARLHTQTLE
jgi:hypothetical protein